MQDSSRAFLLPRSVSNVTRKWHSYGRRRSSRSRSAFHLLVVSIHLTIPPAYMVYHGVDWALRQWFYIYVQCDIGYLWQETQKIRFSIFLTPPSVVPEPFLETVGFRRKASHSNPAATLAFKLSTCPCPSRRPSIPMLKSAFDCIFQRKPSPSPPRTTMHGWFRTGLPSVEVVK